MTQEHNNTPELESAPIRGLLFRYSLPSIAGMVVYALYNIIDSIFLGHGVGALAISGLAVAFPLMNLTFAFSILVGAGGAAVSSIRLGEKDRDGAGRVLGAVSSLSLLFGLLIGLICLLFLDGILVLFGAGPDTLPYARDFMQIFLPALPVSYLMSNLNQMMRANGYPRKAMGTLMLSVAVNLVLAPLFIFVFHWGIRGTALATVLAQSVATVWTIAHFMNRDSLLHFQRGIYVPDRALIRNVLSVGLAPSLLNACACMVVALINTGLQEHGGDMAVGAYGIVNRVLLFIILIVSGLTLGMQPIIGYNYGAGRTDRVRETLKYGILAGTAITTAGFLIAQLLPRPIAMLFTGDAQLIDYAVSGLRIAAAMFPLTGSQIVLSSFFQALGRARLATVFSISRQLLFLIPGLIVFPRYLGMTGVWISLPVADLLASLVTAWFSLVYLRKLLPAPVRK